MKKTQAIKERLNAHREMLEKLATLKQELEYAVDAYGSPRAIDYSGMPHGSGDGTSEMERVVLRKVALEERVKQKESEIAADWAELEPFVERLAPSETLVINLRYYYGAEWREICQRIYGKHDDYEIEADQYMDKMFRTHGRALLNLAVLYTHKPA